MNNKACILKVCWCYAVIIFSVNLGINAFAQENKLEEYYNKWHDYLFDSKYGPLSEAFLFDTERNRAEYVEVINYFLNNNLKMSDYLCERLAKGQIQGQDIYLDTMLLFRLSGINLVDDNPSYSIVTWSNATKITVPIFQKEWNEGVYKSPNQKMRILCEELTIYDNDILNNKQFKIDPSRLNKIKRYGIYAVPELIRQIRHSNSRYCFAAFLISTQHFTEHQHYIEEGEDYGYKDVNSKMELIKQWYRKENIKEDNKAGTMKLIGSAIME